MKNFEKWNKNNKAYLPLLDNTIASERLKSWRAALEWAENQFVGKSAFEAEEAINKELRDL